jgi:lipid A 3-O-deacylase
VKKYASLLTLLIAAIAAPQAHAASNDQIIAAFGYYDFDKDGDRGSVDYRMDYQWGASLIPMMNKDWAGAEKYVQLHPVAGFEGTGDGATYFNGGLNLDIPIPSTPLVFTWGEAIGWYGHGDSSQGLGSPFEMRSQLALDWQFNNGMAAGAYISHLSNLDAGDANPGAEIVGAQLHVPVSWLAHAAK